MERIDLYDRYVHNMLSEPERQKFDELLESDEEFSSEFKIYLMTIDGICREAHQDNLDFGLAMKNLTKEQLQSIIGKRVIDKPQIAAITCPADGIPSAKPTNLRFKPIIWKVASFAAIIILIVSIVFNVEQNARHSIDDAVFAFAYDGPNIARSGEGILDITTMDNDDLKASLIQMEAKYLTLQTEEEIADYGYTIAMAYLRLHDRDNAKAVLEKLIARFDGNDDYAEIVNKWKSILAIIK